MQLTRRRRDDCSHGVSKGPKRHHYLAESYLEGFSSDGRGVWVYDIAKHQLRGQTIKDTCVQSHYNTLVAEDGSRSLEVEAMLSQIEGDVRTAIQTLDAGGPVSSEQRAALATFVALQKLRVPEFEAQVNATTAHLLDRLTRMAFVDEQRAQASIDETERFTGEPAGVTAAEMVEFAAKGEYDLRIHRNLSLEMMVSLAPDLAARFLQMEWAFLRAPDGVRFLTTDSPFILVPPLDWAERNPLRGGLGIAIRGVRKIFPLSGSVALVMFDAGTLVTYRNVSAEAVHDVNEQLAADAFRFVVGHDPDTVDRICAKVRGILAERNAKWGGSKLVIR